MMDYEEHIYALHLEDGSVQIMQLLPVLIDGKMGYVNAEDEAMRLPCAPYIVGMKKIERKDIPEDRTFRNAWDHKLNVDMPRARDVARDMLRERRKDKLAATDIEFRRAKTDAARAKIEEKAQRLRDWPGRIELENAKTPEKLIAAVEAISSED